MFRKVICFLSAAGIAVAVRLPVRAEQTGTIRVVPQWCTQEITGGNAILYQVGESVEGGYRITDGLADWVFWEEEVASDMLLDWLLQQNRKPLQQRDSEELVFTDLSPGLYLVGQTDPAEGYSGFLPFLQEVPANGNWEIVCNPQLISWREPPQTGDRPAPIFAAMGIGFAVAGLMVLSDRRKK